MHDTERGRGNPAPTELSRKEKKALKKELSTDLKEIEARIAQDPQNADLHIEKGRVLGQLLQFGNPMAAMRYINSLKEAFQTALELDPEHIGAHFGLGMMKFHTPQGFGGDLDGAIAHFEFVVDTVPANTLETLLTEAHLMLGQSYNRKEDTPQAIAHFEQALALDPTNAQAKEALAELGG